MPYIKQEDREDCDLIDEFIPKSPGQFNYIISCLAKNYLMDKGKNYQHINDIVGALEGAKLEFYRRVAAPYEDTKIKENGDVY